MLPVIRTRVEEHLRYFIPHRTRVGVMVDGAALALGRWQGSSLTIKAALRLGAKFAAGAAIPDETVKALLARLERLGRRAESAPDEWAFRAAYAVLTLIVHPNTTLGIFYLLRIAYQTMTNPVIDPDLHPRDRARLAAEYRKESERAFNDAFESILLRHLRG